MVGSEIIILCGIEHAKVSAVLRGILYEFKFDNSMPHGILTTVLNRIVVLFLAVYTLANFGDM